MTRLLLLAFFLLPCISGSSFQQKAITIEVNEKGVISIDRITVEAEDLSKELQQRLWRSYMSNGRMPGAIQLQFSNEVSPEIKKTVMDAIKQGQEKTLTVLALHKYKNKFENIGSRRQDKLKKQFPVLFRKDYLSS